MDFHFPWRSNMGIKEMPMLTTLSTGRLLAVTFGLSVLSAFAVAQRAPMTVRFDGSGKIERGRGYVRVQRVEFDLRPDRSATVTFVGDKRWTYLGSWRAQGTDNYVVDIRRAYGDGNARGEVIVGMKGEIVTNLKIQRGYADGMSFSGSFRVDKYSDWSSPNGGLAFDGSLTGKGTAKKPGLTSTMQSVRFAFRDTGAFSFDVPGAGWLMGTYRRRSNTELSVDVDSAFGLRGEHGTGTITLERDGRTISKVAIKGTASNGAFSFNWLTSSQDSGQQPGADGGQWFSRGNGDLEWGSRDLTLRSVEARLDSRSDFRILVSSGSRSHTLTGTWTWRDSRTAVLDLREVDGYRSVGSGTLTLHPDRRYVTRLIVTGQTGNDRLRVSFNGSGTN